MGNAGLPMMAESSIQPLSFTPTTRRAPQPRETNRRSVHAQVVRLVELILGADDAAPDAFVNDVARQGHSTDALYLELIAPAAMQLGEMWKDDTCSFVDVTVGVGRLQRIVRNLGQEFGKLDESGAERILLTCVSGEQHTLGMIIVAEFFVRDGWSVRMGSPVDTADLVATVSRGRFDVVGFSVACDSNLGRLRRDIAAVRNHSRNRGVRIMVGGRSFNENPALVRRLGADGTAPDARAATFEARRLAGIGEFLA